MNNNRVLHKNNNLSFDKCLMKEAGITIHAKNLQKLMLDIFKTLKHLNPSYLWDLFNEKQVEYNLRTKNLVMLPQIKTLKYGINSIAFRGSILWNALSDDIKTSENVAGFKKKIIGWKGKNCNCRLCRENFFYILSILSIMLDF